MHYKNLVFGATLDSLFYSLKNGYPLVYSIPSKPFVKTKELNDWKYSYFFLSLSGLIPFSDTIKKAKLIENNKVELITEKKRFEVSYDKLFLFDDKGLSNLPQPIGRTTDLVEVYDWIYIRKGSEIKDNIINFPEGIIRQFIFYSKEDSDNPNYKNLIVKSVMSKEELKKDENSELFTRFRAEEELASRYNKKIILESGKREVMELGKNIYEPIKDIIFLDERQEMSYSSDNAYLAKIMEYMGV